MRLNNISDNKGAHQRRRALGRGIGSGRGKTCSRGGKGQTARSGVALKGFEGGQMPLTRRLPKRGFTNVHRLLFSEIPLDRLQKILDEKKLSSKEVIDAAALVRVRMVKQQRDGIKLLANGGVFTHKITLEVAHATRKARELVEAAGGTVVLIPYRVHESKTSGNKISVKEAEQKKQIVITDSELKSSKKAVKIVPEKRKKTQVPQTKAGRTTVEVKKESSVESAGKKTDDERKVAPTAKLAFKKASVKKEVAAKASSQKSSPRGSASKKSSKTRDASSEKKSTETEKG